MKRPEPNFPKRSPEGAARHARKKHVRHAYMDPMPNRHASKRHTEGRNTRGRKP
jgi:hypothetical protein